MDEQYLGSIQLFAGSYAPQNYAFCEGQLMTIQSNQALFSVLGTQYGGDGIRTFALPDMRPKKKIFQARLQNTSVKRAHETGDPGTIGYVEDNTVLGSIVEKDSDGWGNQPRYIICLFGVYPPRD